MKKIEIEPKWWGHVMEKFFGKPKPQETFTHRWRQPLQPGECLEPMDPWEWEDEEDRLAALKADDPR